MILKNSVFTTTIIYYLQAHTTPLPIFNHQYFSEQNVHKKLLPQYHTA